MTRGYDFVVVGVIWVVAIVVHLMSVELFAPGTAMHIRATSATALDGPALADQWYMILHRWVPLISAGGITAWAFVREYRRQARTAVRRRP